MVIPVYNVRDYLDRCGEDDLEHYEVKIRASQLLLDHVGDTFVTPVFNGSASLRDAAGQLIENTAKSVRRKETVDDAYMDELFRDVNSLYRLGSASTGGRKDLGPLPGTAVFLLSALVVVWILLLAYWLFERLRKRKRENGT